METITFGTLQARLLAVVKNRIQNGEFTERGLARIVGISQPQMHNVLKGARTLQMDLADKIMAKLGLTATHLFEPAELEFGRLLARDQNWQAQDNRRHGIRDEQERLRSIRKPATAGTSFRRSQKTG